MLFKISKQLSAVLRADAYVSFLRPQASGHPASSRVLRTGLQQHPSAPTPCTRHRNACGCGDAGVRADGYPQFISAKRQGYNASRKPSPKDTGKKENGTEAKEQLVFVKPQKIVYFFYFCKKLSDNGKTHSRNTGAV